MHIYNNKDMSNYSIQIKEELSDKYLDQVVTFYRLLEENIIKNYAIVMYNLKIVYIKSFSNIIVDYLES